MMSNFSCEDKFWFTESKNWEDKVKIHLNEWIHIWKEIIYFISTYRWAFVSEKQLCFPFLHSSAVENSLFFTPISHFSCLIFPPFHHSVPTSFFSSVTAAVDSMTSPFPIGLGGMGSTFLTATVAAGSSKEPEVEELLEKIRLTVLTDCAKNQSEIHGVFVLNLLLP